jgi:hypothetical protein
VEDPHDAGDPRGALGRSQIRAATALLTTGLNLDVAYPTLNGGFDGSGPAVDCDGPGGLASLRRATTTTACSIST